MIAGRLRWRDRGAAILPQAAVTLTAVILHAARLSPMKPPALSEVWRSGSPNRLCAQRGQLLCDVPDRRQLLADRALSRLLKDDWPRTLEELDERIDRGRLGR